MRPDGVLRCEDVPAGNRVSYELTSRGPLPPVMAVMIGRGLEHDLATLKHMLEKD